MPYTWFISLTDCNFNYVLGCFLSCQKTVQRCATARKAAEQEHPLVYKRAVSHRFCIFIILTCVYLWNMVLFGPVTDLKNYVCVCFQANRAAPQS